MLPYGLVNQRPNSIPYADPKRARKTNKTNTMISVIQCHLIDHQKNVNGIVIVRLKRDRQKERMKN